MTNHNPATSQSHSPNRDTAQDRLRQSAILAKVNAHADRSMDRLFADIEELLSGDLETPPQSTPVEQVTHSTPYSPNSSPSDRYPQAEYRSAYPPQSDFTPSQPPVELNSPPANKPDRGARIPLWLKALLGVGITSIATGGIFIWLINEGKIVLPQNIDTSWVPFLSQSQVSPADLKFANYMRKSLSKIETASRVKIATNLPNPANNIPAATTPTSQSPAITASPVVVAAPATTSAAPNPLKIAISLVKTLKAGDRGSAVFQIDGKNQTTLVGRRIGTSNWSLLSVSKSQVIVKKTGGEIRSISVGQKF